MTARRRLLLIRPEADSAATETALSGIGVAAIRSPLLRIVEADRAGPVAADADAIAVTSANGIRALARIDPSRNRPVFAVGRATAEVSRALGYQTVHSADGDARALGRLIAERLPLGARVVHVCGVDRAGSLGPMLEHAGIDVVVEELYEAQPVSALSREAHAALQAGRDGSKAAGVDGVLIFSPRSARLFASVLKKEGLTEAATHLVAFCLSRKVADALGTAMPSMQAIVADRPDQRSLIDSIARYFDEPAQPDRT